MTATTDERHWLLGCCTREPHPKHPWTVRPWLVPRGDRDWTLATDLRRMVLLAGRHADAQPATDAVRAAVAPFLAPPPPGEVYVWDEFRAWLGPVPPPDTCPECKGDGKWRPDPFDESTPPANRVCDLCAGDKVVPWLPERLVDVRGTVVNASQLAELLDCCARVFGENDLVDVYVPPPRRVRFGKPLTGPLHVRTPFWEVVLSTFDGRDDSVTAGWPPPPVEAGRVADAGGRT